MTFKTNGKKGKRTQSFAFNPAKSTGTEEVGSHSNGVKNVN